MPKKKATPNHKIETPISTPIRKPERSRKLQVKEKHRRHISLEYEEPDNWKEMYSLIKTQRATITAPLDLLGHSIAKEGSEGNSSLYRYETLISHMLSSQTKDEMTAKAMENLKAYGLTPTKMAEISIDDLHALVKPVRFYSRKAQYIKDTTKVLIEKYEGDIPKTIPEILKLKGVGSKMAYGIANMAWGNTFGIGVDVHLHRIANRLGWVNTSDGDETRKALESFLPKDKWQEVNVMIGGFGQTICKSTPNCSECAVTHLCPSSQAIKPSTPPEIETEQ